MRPQRLDTRRLTLVGGLVLFTALAWDTVLVYPVKVLVVMMHEISHGLAAVLTGGSVDHIEVSAQLGGVCYTLGGWEPAIVSAGYLGSFVLGAAMFLAAARTRHDQVIAFATGIALVALTLVYVRSTFGVVSGLLFGGFLIVSGKYLTEKVNDVLLSFIGLTSMLYAVIDIKEDLISRTVPGSDAYRMSEIFPLPAVVWGCIWALLSIAGAFLVVRNGLKGDGS